jgi:phenylalanyl-tRNA synthetase alpha chain
MLERLKNLKTTAEEEISKVTAIADLENLRVRYLGKKGELTEILKGAG